MADSVLQTGYVNAKGTRIYYEAMGEGQPLVLIHGLNLDTRMWDGQFSEFAKKYRVIRFDLRGMGKTQINDEPFSMYGDIHTLLTALNVEQACLVGLSFGGYAAVEYILAHPEMVNGLVLVSAALFNVPPSDERKLAAAQLNEVMKSGDLEKSIDLTLNMWLDGPGQSANRVNQQARELFRQITYDAYTSPLVSNTPKWLSHNLINRLNEIQVPTLTIVGDLDFSDFRAVSDIYAEKIKGAKQIIMNGSAHIPPVDQSELFNEMVLKFLNENLTSAK